MLKTATSTISHLPHDESTEDTPLLLPQLNIIKDIWEYIFQYRRP